VTAATLPKTNLHLHLTGAMRPATLAELAARGGLPLPLPFTADTVHEWPAFQQRYDLARAAIRGPTDIERVVVEAATDDAVCGAEWIELQIDPTSYAAVAGGLAGAVEAALAGAARAPIPVGLIVAASWAAPPEHALRLATLAASYAGRGVVGFGLSNDERLGRVADVVPACRVAAEAGLKVVPHGGFYTPPSHVADCVTLLGAHRIGHGLAAMRDPATRDLLASRGVALEICPTSYPPLGVSAIADLPIRELRAAGVLVVLGTDDPLLFGSDLATQYTLVTTDPAEQADLARCAVTASAAPPAVRDELFRDIAEWEKES
jgi:adenosine deaminase